MAGVVAVLCAEAESAMLAGDGPRAARSADDALAAAAGPAERATALCLRGRVATMIGDGPDVLHRMRAEAQDLEDVDRAAAGRVMVDAALLALYCRDPDAVVLARRGRELVAEAGPALRALASAMVGLACDMTGVPPPEGIGHDHGGEFLRLGGRPQEVVQLLQLAVVGLASRERYREALDLCHQYVSAIRRVGAEGLLPTALCLLANTAYFTAEFDVAEMAAAEALALAQSRDQRPPEIFARMCLALSLAVTGEPGEAREQADAALAAIDATGLRTWQSTVHLALALSELGSGDWDSAVADLGVVEARFNALPWQPGIAHWRAEQVEALWRAGESDAARRAYATLAATVAGDGPWERAAAARVGALLADDDSAAEALFDEAVRWHEQSVSSFERGRTELCWGEWLLDHDRPGPAAAHLKQARDAFAALRATAWLATVDGLIAVARDRGGEEVAPPDDSPAPVPEAIHAFGPLTLVRGGAQVRVAMDLPGRALRYLVAAGGSVHAEQLIDELWPDASPESGSTRLRTVLTRIRSRYGPVVVRDGTVLRWADRLSVDVRRFRELAHTALSRPRDDMAVAAAREAVGLYSGDLLPLERDADWLVGARERLRQRYLDLLGLLCDDAVERDDLPVAIGYVRDLVDHDPMDTEAYVRLARLQLEAGRAGPARETLRRARRVVDELGIESSAAVTALERRMGIAGN